MSPRVVVYTCVFAAYDRVFPPVHRDPSIDYILITDDVATVAPGWRKFIVDKARFRGIKAPNRYFKMLAHHEGLDGYDVSIYVDGNIRIIGRTKELACAFLRSGAAVGACRHPLRSSVAEEATRCLSQGKVCDAATLELELDQYRSEGFPDEQGLFETGVVLKNHSHPALDVAMELWWSLFERYDSRDQLSLPYVKWKLGVPTFFIEPGFRDPNPYFGIYPHFGAGVSPRTYTYLAARSFDSPIHSLLFKLWNYKWIMQRAFRKLLSRRF